MISEDLEYNVTPPCHPEAQVTFTLTVDIRGDGGIDYPDHARMHAECPICHAPYAAMNSGPRVLMRAVGATSQDAVWQALADDLAR